MKFKFLYMLTALIMPVSSVFADHCPYQADQYTLHLYHFDGDTADAVSTNAIDLILGNTADVDSYSDYLGFGKMLDTSASAASIAYATEDLSVSNFTGSDGAFTFEAMIKFNPDATRPSIMQIITGEGDSSNDRGWQFRINSSNQLEFINLSNSNASYAIALPTSGDDSLKYSKWYHVAVTYNGQAGVADNLKFYWTAVEYSTDLVPKLLSSFSMAADVTPTDDIIDFSVGNENRSTGGSTDNLPGWIDEVRISSIAREPEDMIYQCDLDIAEITSQPQDLSVKVSESGSTQVSFQSDSTPVVVWYQSSSDSDVEISLSDYYSSSVELTDGTYTATLLISDAEFDLAGTYYALITNNSGIYVVSDTASVSVLGEIAYWPMGSGYYSDGYYLETTTGYHALAYNEPVFAAGVDSASESAAAFAADQGQAFTAEFSVIPDTGSFTISFWADCTDDSFSSGVLSVNIGSLDLSSSTLVSTNKWHHFAITAENDIVSVYVDSNLAVQGNWSIPQFYSAFMAMGGLDDDTAFNGLLDELKIFNYSLSADDVASLYSEYSSGTGKTYGISDLARFVSHWMECGRYPQSQCN